MSRPSAWLDFPVTATHRLVGRLARRSHPLRRLPASADHRVRAPPRGSTSTGLHAALGVPPSAACGRTPTRRRFRTSVGQQVGQVTGSRGSGRRGCRGLHEGVRGTAPVARGSPVSLPSVDVQHGFELGCSVIDDPAAPEHPGTLLGVGEPPGCRLDLALSLSDGRFRSVILRSAAWGGPFRVRVGGWCEEGGDGGPECVGFFDEGVVAAAVEDDEPCVGDVGGQLE
jgi:hypothetical protein